MPVSPVLVNCWVDLIIKITPDFCVFPLYMKPYSRAGLFPPVPGLRFPNRHFMAPILKATKAGERSLECSTVQYSAVQYSEMKGSTIQYILNHLTKECLKTME